jgi:hypothetical protein
VLHWSWEFTLVGVFVKDLPPGERRSKFVAGSTGRKRASAGAGPHQNEHRRISRGDRVDLTTDGRALCVVQVVEALNVEDEDEARTNANSSAAQSGDVAFDERDVAACLLRASSCRLDRLGYHVDTHDLPAALRKPDRPSAGSTAQIKRGSVRRLTPRFLDRKELIKLWTHGR